MITDRTESIFTKHMHERDALHTLSQALKGFSIESERMGSSVRVPESGSKTSGKSMRVAGFGGGGARGRATAARRRRGGGQHLPSHTKRSVCGRS
jgi:hypothetical protein